MHRPVWDCAESTTGLKQKGGKKRKRKATDGGPRTEGALIKKDTERNDASLLHFFLFDLEGGCV